MFADSVMAPAGNGCQARTITRTRARKTARAPRQSPTLPMGDPRLWSNDAAPVALELGRQAPKADAGSPKAGVRPGQAVVFDCRRQESQIALATLEQAHRIRFMSNVKTGMRR